MNVMGLFIWCNRKCTFHWRHAQSYTPFSLHYKGLKPFPPAVGLLLAKGCAVVCFTLVHPGAGPIGTFKTWGSPISVQAGTIAERKPVLHIVHNMFLLPRCLEAAITFVTCPFSPPHHHCIRICCDYRPKECKLPLTQNRVIPHNTGPCFCTVLQPWPFVFLWWSQAS